MGMTPAVALTTQSLEPVQAFAAETTVDITDGTASYDGTDSTLGAYGSVTAGPTGNFELKFKPSADASEITISHPTVTWDTADGNAPDWSKADAKTYKATLTGVYTDNSDADNPTIYNVTAANTIDFTISACNLSLSTPTITEADDLATLTKEQAAALITPTFSDGTNVVTIARAGAGVTDTNTYTVQVTDLTNNNNGTSTAKYTVTVAGGNYNLTGTTTNIEATISQKVVAATEVTPDTATFTNNGDVYTGSGITPVVSGNIVAQDSANKVYQIAPTASGVAITWKDKDNKDVKTPFVNAGDYTAYVTIKDALATNGTTCSTNGAVELGTFTIAQQPLTIVPPAAIPENLSAAQAKAMFSVTGVRAADANVTTPLYTLDVTGTFPTEAGQKVTASLSAVNANYAAPTPVELTVQEGVTIGANTYIVSLAANGQTNVVEGATNSYVYSYNGQAQTPKVVFTNVADGSQIFEAPSGCTVLYGAKAADGKWATGSTTVPTAVGQYMVWYKVGTKDPVEIGTYEIAKANINKSNEVLITWNGQTVSGTTATVSTNDPNEWKQSLKVTYPSSGITVAYPEEYTVNFKSETTLSISPEGTNANSNLIGNAITLTLDVANYQVDTVALKPAFTDAPHTYTGKAIEVKSSDLVVTGSDGSALAYNTDYTFAVTNNINAGTATITVTGMGNYAGEKTTTFTIAPCDISKLTFAVTGEVLPYTAEAQTPSVLVADAAIFPNGEEKPALSETVTAENKSKLFKVTYQNNTNASTATNKAKAVVTAVSPNFTGSKEVEFSIPQFDISAGSATTANLAYSATATSYPIASADVKSGLKVNGAAVPMTSVDYTIVQNTGKNGSTSLSTWTLPTVTPNTPIQQEYYYAIVGQGNYTGTISGSYFVTDQTLEDYIGTQFNVPECTFDGEEQEPKFEVKLKGSDELISSDDFAANGLAVNYTNNRNAGQATLTITASGKVAGVNGLAYYGAPITKNFTIKPAAITGATFGIVAPEENPTLQYTGEQIKPTVAVKDTDALAPSTPTGAVAGVFATKAGGTINLEDIKDEYTVSYGANVNVTDVDAKKNFGTVTITPTSGNMTGTAIVQFVINKANIENTEQFTVDIADYGIYKKQPSGASFAVPEVTITTKDGKKLVEGVDYTVTVPNTAQTINKPVLATVKGIGNYTGTITHQFTVVRDIAEAAVELQLPATPYVYDGNAKTPVPVVTYKEGNNTITLKQGAATNGGNYTVSYENNVNAGTATVIIKGTGNEWGGEVKKTFTIEQAEGALAIDAVANYTYTGAARTPEPDFTFTVGSTAYKKADLEAGTDYKYVYTNNVNSSAVSGKKATVSVEMMGNYGAKGAKAVEFTIEQANVAQAEVVVGDVVVNGTPKVAVSMGGRALVQGTDFIFAADTKTTGTKTATVTGKGNYTGTQKVTFTVLNENQIPVNPDNPNVSGGTWKKVNGKWQYTTKDGKLLASGWAKINGKWYFFDSSSNAATGWVHDGGKWYYCNTSSDKGTEAAMVSNAWKKINGNWYYFTASGAAKTGWFSQNGTWYYLNKAGEGTECAMATGWKYVDNNWFYFNTSGAMQTGWQLIRGNWYLLNTEHDGTYGAALTGWHRVDHATGKLTTANTWYYMYEGSCAMAANTWVGNYHVDGSGYWDYSA